jgi:hypothetical protein
VRDARRSVEVGCTHVGSTVKAGAGTLGQGGAMADATKPKPELKKAHRSAIMNSNPVFEIPHETALR